MAGGNIGAKAIARAHRNVLAASGWRNSTNLRKPLISAGLEKLFMIPHRSRQQHMTTTRPVLIVGAGPTGMTAAI